MQTIKCKCGRVVTITKQSVRCGCGERVYSDGTLPMWKPESPCIHRGESTRAVDCPSCRGSVKVKVFQCAIHEECTIKKRAGELKTCYGCTDHTIS